MNTSYSVEPGYDTIKQCDETVTVNEEALRRLLNKAENSYPQNAGDRIAMQSARNALY